MSPYAKNDALILAALEIPGWFETKVLARLETDANGCRLWTGSKCGKYGSIQLPDRRSARVHRVVWIAERGPIPTGLVLDHDGPNGCRVRLCANPEHLAVATLRENALSGDSVTAANLRKSECPRGHSLTGSNSRSRGGQREGQRECLRCRRDAVRDDQRLVSCAARALGMRVTDYRREFGQSRGTALEVLAMGVMAA